MPAADVVADVRGHVREAVHRQLRERGRGGGRLLGPLPRRAAAVAVFAGPGRRWSMVDGLGGADGDARRVQDLLELAVDGRLRVEVERTYDLVDAAAAVDHLRRGSTRGKVVVTV